MDEDSDKYGVFFCHLCGESGGINKIRYHFGDPKIQLDIEYQFSYSPILVAATEHYIEALDQNPDAYEYLTETRGLTEETVIKAKLGWADGKLNTYLINKGFSPEEIKATGLVNKHGLDYFKNEIIFPYLDHGFPVQLRGKEIGGKARGTPEPHKVPYGIDTIIGEETVLLAEGEADTLTLHQLGYPAIGVPGVQTFKEDWLDLLEDAKRIYIMYDNDKAGKAGSEKVAGKIGSRARVVEIPYKNLDVNDLLVKKGMNRDDFDYLLHKAKGGLLVSISEAYDRWLEIEGNKDLDGLRFNVPKLDNAMSIGLLPGQVAVLIAKTGSAKSIMSMNLFQRMRIADPDIQILYASLELTRNQVFEAMFRIHQLYFPGSMEADFIHYWKNNLLLVDQNRISENDLAESIDQYAYELGFVPNLICVDYLGYYARGVSGSSEYDQTTNAIMGLKSVAKEMQAVFLVPHQVNRTGDFAKELQADQAKSSGAVENTADWLASQWSMDTQPGIAPEDATGEVFQKILKSRNGGTNTLATYIFDPLSLGVVPIDDHEMASRAYFMRDCFKAGDDFKQAIKRLETGDLTI